MEDVTIIIQGRLDQECYDFYVSKYSNCPVIISTWTNTQTNFANLPSNFKVILSAGVTVICSNNLDEDIKYPSVPEETFVRNIFCTGPQVSVVALKVTVGPAAL